MRWRWNGRGHCDGPAIEAGRAEYLRSLDTPGTVVVPLMTAMVVVGGQLMALSPAPPSPPRRSHRLAESRQERLCRWRFAGALGSVAGRRLFADTSSAAFTPGAARGLGYLLFVRDQTLVAQPFAPARLQPTGELFPVAEQVARANIHWGKFSITPGGVLAYSSGTSASRTQLVWFDREGKRFGGRRGASRSRQPRPVAGPEEGRLSAVRSRQPGHLGHRPGAGRRLPPDL
jgi:hypothetical protein